MKDFLSRYAFILIFTGIVMMVGVIFIGIVELNLHLSRSTPTSSGSPTHAPVIKIVPDPVVTLTIQRSKGANNLIIDWQNLPSGTTALNIFRGLKNSTSGWSLWRSVFIRSDQLGSGSLSLNLGTASVSPYSFYIEAVNGNGGGAGANTSSTVLWTSSLTQPSVTASAVQGIPPSAVPSQSPPSSSTNNPAPAPAPSPSLASAPAPAPTPSGTPFYNPQVQVEGYQQQQAQNFWVQHVDQKIQIGWQNLPPTTNNLVIFRAPNQDGPWSVVLSQKNPGVNGAYSIQIVDNTLGQPYYYEMNAAADNVTIATYGPVYLASE